MIHSIEIKDPTATCIAWLSKVPALEKPCTFEFKPGLNILWGKNGSGKSTLIKLMGTMLHCMQGGVPAVTEASVDNFFAGARFDLAKEQALQNGVVFRHDGQAVRHFDPSHAVGLAGSTFDWDFGMEGISNAMFRGSAGQTTSMRFQKLLGAIVEGGELPAVRREITRERVNDIWKKRIDIAESFLKGTAEKGPPTVLLDEPERSYDLPTQVGCWRMLRAYARTTQFIVASHSLYALNIPEANYIELEPGYLGRSRGALSLLEKWAEEKPEPLPPEEVKRGKRKKGEGV